MRSLAEVQDQLAYHPATVESARRHDSVRMTLSETARRLWETVPDGPEKTLAMRALQQCGMYCNLAIALEAPVDHYTADVARVLPFNHDGQQDGMPGD